MKIESIQNKVHSDFQSFEKMLNKWKFFEESIVFTNGCFDILHYGHLAYLSQASEMGSRLIIGLNSDDSVRRLKGDKRPVNPQAARAMILASLVMVDAVVLFDDDTPLDLIVKIMPNTLVKGSDYSIDQIAGAKEVLANGGEVKTIDYIAGYSTTNILNRK